jgi:hypothetical protein
VWDAGEPDGAFALFFVISVSETSIDTVSNGYCLVKCDAVIR